MIVETTTIGGSEKLKLSVKTKGREIEIFVDEDGSVKVFGAGKTVVAIQCFVRAGLAVLGNVPMIEGDKGKEPLFVTVGAGPGAMEGGVDIYANKGADSMFAAIPCIVAAPEDGELIVKVRDGLGSWKNQIIWNNQGKETTT